MTKKPTEDLRSGDTVFHMPTEEEWIVAEVIPRRNELSWAGWPYGCADISDCRVIERCTDEEHISMLNKMVSIPDSSDPRRVYAKRVLSQMDSAKTKENG